MDFDITNTDKIAFYSDEVKKMIQEFYTERENGFPDGGKPEYRFYEIPCKSGLRILRV